MVILEKLETALFLSNAWPRKTRLVCDPKELALLLLFSFVSVFSLRSSVVPQSPVQNSDVTAGPSCGPAEEAVGSG